MHSIIKLLTLNIKTMKKEDLKLGEYYVYDKRQVLIFKGIKVNTKVLSTERNHFSTQSYAYSLSDIRLATPEEKHWLDVCINKDTFVPREIAMVTFKSKEIDFIYGEWYKSNHNNGGRWFYLKALRSMTGVGKRVEGEGISSAGYYNRDTYWNLEDAINQALKLGPMTDLTEIQEFLPAGHIDKIDKIVKNTSNRVILCTTKDEWDDLCDSKIAQSSKVQKNWFYSSPKYMYIDEGLHGERLPSSDYYVYTYSEFKKKYDTPSAEAKTILLQDVKADQYYYAEYEEERCRAHGTYMSKERAKELGIKEVTIPHQSVFLKDDYIVTLQEVSSSFPKNHIFKQRETTDYLRVYKDIRGEANGNTIAKFTKTSLWRYATTQEIMEYDIQDRPVDVSRIGMSPKQNVEPIKTNTMAPDKWCIEMDYDHPDRLEVINFINVAWKAGMTGSGGFYYLENGKVKCNTFKPIEYDLMSIAQFKRYIMTSPPQSVPYVFTLPPQWYMLVTEENKYDAEVWRWEGNPRGYELEIGQLIGIPDHGGKSHNPGKSTTNFGTQISYIQFKAHVLTKEEKGRLITNAFPVGSCVVVTKGSYGKNGKENHCYKVIEHTGIGTGDISLKYQSCNSIGLSHVRVRSATASETTRYQREGKPYDVTSLDTLIHESSNTETDPYAGKSLEEMLVICRKMFPKGCKYKTLKGGDFPGVYTLGEELVIQGMGTSNEGISRIGLPWFFYKGEILCERVDDYNAEITPHGQPTKDASKEEILAYCKKMYPKGTVIQGGYVVTKELIWEGSDFISHAGLGIVYNQRDHSFANILSFTHVQEPTKTLKDLPKKATLSDVSALVKHQEPVIAFSKKAKRSKLVIINK